MRRSASLVVSSLILGLAACASAVTTFGSDASSDVRANRIAQNQAIAAVDLDQVQTYWHPNVSVTSGLGTALRGRAAYRRAFEQDSSIIYERLPQVIEVSDNYPIAWEQGYWTGRRRDGAEAPIIEGHYAAHWVKLGDQWRIRSEVFSALKCSAEACDWPVVLTQTQ